MIDLATQNIERILVVTIVDRVTALRFRQGIRLAKRLGQYSRAVRFALLALLKVRRRAMFAPLPFIDSVQDADGVHTPRYECAHVLLVRCPVPPAFGIL
jgi:hypothetical protein